LISRDRTCSSIGLLQTEVKRNVRELMAREQSMRLLVDLPPPAISRTLCGLCKKDL
jgi:hypothetical protein